ncbi:hypothetical protein GpartN1_g84.t1 [Galdieria partita]|uniref:Clathrin/coatomer adaptor adaptin-like N-terminal domain-containing protein n=1 Tax=Galdieria partita TaxID=83374 RepID=A0A9C7PPM2_9RHOD|nr:hypothetical protein GpartN1_g84.t1 [Galdieria partita]
MLQGSYRGLTNFVTEIRDCKTYDLEKERVTKELEKVQSVLSEPKSKAYDRIKSTLKLLYIQTLGYDISSFENHCLFMAKSSNYLEKRAGYLTFPVFLGTETASQDRFIRILQADLVASEDSIKFLALSTLSNLAPTETNSKVIIDSVIPLLSQRSSRELCQRAFCCLSLLCWTETGWKFLTSQDASRLFQQYLAEKDPGLLTSVISLLYKIIVVAKDNGQLRLFTHLLLGLFQILEWLLGSSFDASSYFYYEVPCPFLLSEVWKLIGLFTASAIVEVDRQSKSSISNLFLKCLSYIQSGDHSNRRNASFSISFEALKVVSKLPFSEDLFRHTLTVIMSLISEDVRPTTRYFVLRALKELSFLPETWTSIQRNFSVLLPLSSQSDDIDIKQQASLWFHLTVDLLSEVCNVNNVEQVLDLILRISSMFLLSSLQQRLVVDKCLSLMQRFLQNEEKLLAVVLFLLSACDETEEITSLFLTRLQRSKFLQSESMKELFHRLHSGSLLEPGLLQLVLLVFPTYSYLLISSGACTAVDMVKLLYRQVWYHTKLYNLQNSFLNFLMKWVQYYPEAVSVAVNILKRYAKSQNLEVQNRACEYLRFISHEISSKD